jgi:hypothetical protein
VLVMEVAQVGIVFRLGLQVGVVKLWWAFKLGCSSRGVQVGCCKILVSIFRWSKPPHHVKVNPLGEMTVVGVITSLSVTMMKLVLKGARAAYCRHCTRVNSRDLLEMNIRMIERPLNTIFSSNDVCYTTQLHHFVLFRWPHE